MSTLTVVNNALGDKAPTNAAKLENMGDTGSSLIKPKLQGIFKLAVFEKGAIFGIYKDTFRGELGYRQDSTHEGTVTCSSTKGILYRMPVIDFEKRIYLKFDMQSEIERLVKEKGKQMGARQAKIGGIYNITPHQIREEELQANNVKEALSDQKL